MAGGSVRSTNGYLTKTPTPINTTSQAFSVLGAFYYSANTSNGQYDVIFQFFKNTATRATLWEIYRTPPDDGTPNHLMGFWRDSGNVGHDIDIASNSIYGSWIHWAVTVSASGTVKHYLLQEGFNPASPSYLTTVSLGTIQQTTNEFCAWVERSAGSGNTDSATIATTVRQARIIACQTELSEANVLDQFASRDPISAVTGVDYALLNCDDAATVEDDTGSTDDDWTKTSTFTDESNEPSEWAGGITGSGACTTQSFAASGSASITFSSSATVAEALFAAAAAGIESFTASGTAAESPFAASASGSETFTGSGSVAQSSFASSASNFPLIVAPGGRYLWDAFHRPFFLQGDSGWDIALNLTKSEVREYLADRAARGFNATLFLVLDTTTVEGSSANRDSDIPFSTPADFSTPNSAYFDHLEWVVSRCAEFGIVAFVFPLYFGFDGGSEGWYQYFAANGATAVTNFAAYVASRLKQFANVVWVIGGDYLPPDATFVNAIYDGIVSEDLSHLITTNYSRGHASFDLGGLSFSPDINWGYEAPPIYTQALENYDHSPPVPHLIGEAYYENEHSVTALTLRGQAYQSILSGGFGYFFGNDPIWFFGRVGDGNPYHSFADSDVDDWDEVLDSQGAQDVQRFGEFFRPRRWHDLIPDESDTLVTAGKGSGASYVMAASTADGLFAAAYCPTTGLVTVNTSLLACNGGTSIRASWFDPTDGSYSTIATYTTGGSRNFTPSGTNAAGDDDWVLVFESLDSGAIGSVDVSTNTVAASATVSMSSSGSAAEQPFAASGSGLEMFAATGTAAESPFAADGSGTAQAGFSSSGSAASSSFAVASAGTETFAASGSSAEQPFAADGSGVSGDGLSGSGSAAASPFASDGSGAQTFSASAAAAGSPFAATSSASEEFATTGAAAEQPFAADGEGATGDFFTSSGSVALSSFACTASGLETFSTTCSAAVSQFACSGSAAETFASSGSSAIASFACSASGLGGDVSGSGSAALSAFACSGSASNASTAPLIVASPIVALKDSGTIVILKYSATCVKS